MTSPYLTTEPRTKDEAVLALALRALRTIGRVAPFTSMAAKVAREALAKIEVLRETGDAE